jgi:hypothetical protein
MTVMFAPMKSGVCISAVFFMWSVFPASAKDAEKAVLLRRDWPSGREYKLRCRWESDMDTMGNEAPTSFHRVHSRLGTSWTTFLPGRNHTKPNTRNTATPSLKRHS